MKRIVNTLLSLFIIILGASCSRFIVVTPSSTATVIPWWNSWLDHPACKLPCWESITPGMTTIEKALSILKNIPTIKIKYQSELGISWISKEDNTTGGFLSTDNGVVSIIVLDSVYSKLTLEKVVATYGYPSYVEPYDCRDGMCATMLVYPDLGMFMDVFIEDLGIGRHKVKIQPETEVGRISLIPTGLENYKKIPTFQDYGILMEWKGYGEYP